jgi:hypothetical protein
MSYIWPDAGIRHAQALNEKMESLVSYGMPHILADSGLEYPELGAVGIKLHEMNTFESIVVLHEPNITRLRRHTVTAAHAAPPEPKDQ